MPAGLIIVFFVGIFALIAVSAYFSYQAQKKRLAELSQLAAAQGWQFDPSKDYSHDKQYSYFSIFTQGDDRYAYNTLTGGLKVNGQAWPVQLGDYHFETTSTSTDSEGHTTTQRHDHSLSYLIVETPYLGAPHLFVRHEGFFDKIAGMLGFDDIDFESAEFSKKFCVKSPDKRFAYDVIHPRMMEFLLDDEPPLIDFKRGQCCLSRGEKCWSAAEFEATATWADKFFTLWPKHVTSTLNQPEASSSEGRSRE